MKKILIHMKNSLLLQSIELALSKTSDFKVNLEDKADPNIVIEKCIRDKYDILFMDIARSYLYGFEARKKLIYAIKKLNLNVKLVIFCDSNSEPETAGKVRDLKAMGLIDAFFYESVDAKYMIAVLQTL